MRQRNERFEERARDVEMHVPDVERVKSVETGEIRRAPVVELAPQRDLVRSRAVAEQRIAFTALPDLEHGQLMKESDAGVGHTIARKDRAQRRLTGERAN